MGAKNSFGFLALGLFMLFLPTLAPSLFHHPLGRVGDADGARAEWVASMAWIQVLLGGGGAARSIVAALPPLLRRR